MRPFRANFGTIEEDMPFVTTWRIDPEKLSFEQIDLPKPAVTLDAASDQIPDGAYTTFRTYDHFNVARLKDHFERLKTTSGLANHPIEINENLIRIALHQILTIQKQPELRIRITVDLTEKLGQVYVTSLDLVTPAAIDYENGVKTITVRMHRNNPKAKLTGFIHTAKDVRETLLNHLPDVNEALMVDDSGVILEGLSSNFFGVKQGILRTAEEGVLSGITRSLTLKAAEVEGIQVERTPITLEEIESLDEAFITSASRAILPIRQIDQAQIGNGKPGTITKALQSRFGALLRADLEKV
jgi:branched-chain amino acid aminotransferase